MATLHQVAVLFLGHKGFDLATDSRVEFWVDQLGSKELAEITADDVDAALVKLMERGRLKAGRGMKPIATGKPISGPTYNRSINQLASIYKYARRHRILPRNHVPPTKGIEKLPEPVNRDKYFRAEEVERLLQAATVLDTRWKRMRALVATAYCTGLRKGSLRDLRWSAMDLSARTVSVQRTKNGHPIVSPLSHLACEELARLPNRHPDDLVFEGRPGQPFDWDSLYERCLAAAGLPRRERSFHALRHGCASALAKAGVSQPVIMRVMGHRTLAASLRYLHLSTADVAGVVDKVFG